MRMFLSRLSLVVLVVAVVIGCVLQYRMSGPPVYASFQAREPSKYRRMTVLEAIPVWLARAANEMLNCFVVYVHICDCM